jgi:cytidylate kinase
MAIKPLLALGIGIETCFVLQVYLHIRNKARIRRIRIREEKEKMSRVKKRRREKTRVKKHNKKG